MCGIAGIFSSSLPPAEREHFARRMADTIQHRGRDGSGLWSGENISLAHRRLAVLDLSPAGAQPMLTSNGNFALIYNGEIYNHRELRTELHGQIWRGHCDTETLLAAFAEWGIEKTLTKIRGMFAGALWDVREKKLTLFRDRFGEKPLYYGLANGDLVFGSELRCFRELPFSPTINRRALTQLIAAGCSRDCIWENFYSLPPAHFLTFSLASLPSPFTGNFFSPNSPTAYWSAKTAAMSGLKNRFAGSFSAAASAIENLLRSIICEQKIADVPIGALLSGGIDSTLITALLAELGAVKTFTIGFHDHDFDEAPIARRIAEIFHTEHYEIYIDEKTALNSVEKIPQIYDSPFADSSQIPTFLVCQAAKQQVAVALSGDGGDEIFGGYERYAVGDYFWRYWQFFPAPLRRIFSLLEYLPPVIGNQIGALFPTRYPRRWGGKLRRLARALTAENFPDFYHRLLTTGATDLVLTNHDLAVDRDAAITDELHALTFAAQAMLNDQENYLPNDLLVKIDRAAMANTLETRAPLLDYRLAELAWQMPINYHRSGTTGKLLLREILRRQLPNSLKNFAPQKKGFGVPLARWLRGALREWGESLITPEILRRDNFFAAAKISTLWNEHQSGKRDHSATLWNVLMFQQWRRSNS